MVILVVEDDDAFAEIISECLRRDGHDAVIAASVNGALRVAQRDGIELAVLDVMLPDGSGYDVARTLRQQRPEMPLIFLSNLDRLDEKVAGFEAGADDYITKPFHPREFVARVRAVLARSQRGGYREHPPANGTHANGSAGSNGRRPPPRQKGLCIDDASGGVFYNGSPLHCTPTETDVVRELLAVPGQVLTHEYLNERIWGQSGVKAGRLLKGHVSSLRRKIADAGGDPEVLRTVFGMGYSYVPEVNEPAAARW